MLTVRAQGQGHHHRFRYHLSSWRDVNLGKKRGECAVMNTLSSACQIKTIVEVMSTEIERLNSPWLNGLVPFCTSLPCMLCCS